MGPQRHQAQQPLSLPPQQGLEDGRERQAGAEAGQRRGDVEEAQDRRQQRRRQVAQKHRQDQPRPAVGVPARHPSAERPAGRHEHRQGRDEDQQVHRAGGAGEQGENEGHAGGGDGRDAQSTHGPAFSRKAVGPGKAGENAVYTTETLSAAPEGGTQGTPVKSELPRRERPLNVVLFSGGRGSGALSKQLVRRPDVSLSIAINGYDDGLSTGEVRRFLGDALGPSDFRKNASRVARELSSCAPELIDLLDLRLPLACTPEAARRTFCLAEGGGVAPEGPFESRVAAIAAGDRPQGPDGDRGEAGCFRGRARANRPRLRLRRLQRRATWSSQVRSWRRAGGSTRRSTTTAPCSASLPVSWTT